MAGYISDIIRRTKAMQGLLSEQELRDMQNAAAVSPYQAEPFVFPSLKGGSEFGSESQIDAAHRSSIDRETQKEKRGFVSEPSLKAFGQILSNISNVAFSPATVLPMTAIERVSGLPQGTLGGIQDIDSQKRVDPDLQALVAAGAMTHETAIAEQQKRDVEKAAESYAKSRAGAGGVSRGGLNSGNAGGFAGGNAGGGRTGPKGASGNPLGAGGNNLNGGAV